MNRRPVIYETLTRWDSFFLKGYLSRKVRIYLIEPFHSYHHKRGIRFFPFHFPASVEEMIRQGRVSLIKAEEINAKEIYILSADKAVSVIESVFPYYRRRYEKIICHVSDTLRSAEAENVFKISLCNRIAEFYSMNILLHRIEKRFAPNPVHVYPDINVYAYLFVKKLLTESDQEFYEHPSIRFPVRVYLRSLREDLKQNVISTVKVLIQTLASGLLRRHERTSSEKRKDLRYGITIVSPRQLQDNQRGPGFIVDDKEIFASEVVYFPLIPLTADEDRRLARLPGEIHRLESRRLFSHYDQWKRLLFLSIKERCFGNGEELMWASNTFLNYFRWQRIVGRFSIRHFITHGDFGIGHVGRNLALNQAGVQTWYFTDSANLGINLGNGANRGTRHPFWSYLDYDHLVTWDALIAKYYKEHPGSFRKTHIVGCLWSDHIRAQDASPGELSSTEFKHLDSVYVLSCFDSTYSRNGFTSYEEGIAFAEHLLRLINECPDLYVILKEKKERRYHPILDPTSGPKLIEAYNKMSSHPRVKICSNRVDASEIICVSDMVVSFPFTSTTFEALSSNKPAIWHDPMGYYRDTVYGKVGEVVTHTYEELKSKVLEVKEMKPGTYQNPLQLDSPLMDPYRDGKAIDRFRKLLVSS